MNFRNELKTEELLRRESLQVKIATKHERRTTDLHNGTDVMTSRDGTGTSPMKESWWTLSKFIATLLLEWTLLTDILFRIREDQMTNVKSISKKKRKRTLKHWTSTSSKNIFRCAIGDTKNASDLASELMLHNGASCSVIVIRTF